MQAMNLVIARITLRQLLSRRRTLLLLLLGAIVLVVAFVRRISGDTSGGTSDTRFTADLLSTLGIATLMPLVALIFGTGAMGAELEEGTAVYILAKPVSRLSVAFTKLSVAIVCSILLTSVPILLAGLLSGGPDGPALAVGFAVAAAVGSAVYCAIFMALSLVTGRAFVFGLAYVLVWESFLAGLFAGTRTLSVREQTLAFAAALAKPPADVFKADLPLGTAVVVAVLVAALALAITARRMARIEIAGEVT
jgi:ABC-2 type transport system permease protein